MLNVIVAMMLCLTSLGVLFSFTPGFSPVIKDRENQKNRFNGNYIVDSPQQPEGLQRK